MIFIEVTDYNDGSVVISINTGFITSVTPMSGGGSIIKMDSSTNAGQSIRVAEDYATIKAMLP